jgi:hypothetical protein
MPKPPTPKGNSAYSGNFRIQLTSPVRRVADDNSAAAARCASAATSAVRRQQIVLAAAANGSQKATASEGLAIGQFPAACL